MRETTIKSRCFLAPATTTRDVSSLTRISELVGRHNIYAISEQVCNRAKPRKGDRVCFYAVTVGIVADAVIARNPEYKIDDRIGNPKYPMILHLANVRTYLENPFVLNEKGRTSLREFQTRPHDLSWAWFVRIFHEVLEHDFLVMTHRGSEAEALVRRQPWEPLPPLVRNQKLSI